MAFYVQQHKTTPRLDIADLIGRGSAAHKPLVMGLGSEVESRLRALPWGGQSGGGRGRRVGKKRPEVNCFLFAPCKSARFSELQERAAVLKQTLRL